jgi:hypothetical protein
MGGGKAEAEARNAMKRTAEEDADGAVRRPPKDEEADMKVRTTQLQCLTHPLFSFHVSLHYTFFSSDEEELVHGHPQGWPKQT